MHDGKNCQPCTADASKEWVGLCNLPRPEDRFRQMEHSKGSKGLVSEPEMNAHALINLREHIDANATPVD
ncbi:MAG: hypothetical protein ACI8P9_004713 [Parasphingorhabdus sp.]|jgi:hypothetical protein